MRAQTDRPQRPAVRIQLRPTAVTQRLTIESVARLPAPIVTLGLREEAQHLRCLPGMPGHAEGGGNPGCVAWPYVTPGAVVRRESRTGRLCQRAKVEYGLLGHPRPSGSGTGDRAGVQPAMHLLELAWGIARGGVVYRPGREWRVGAAPAQ